MRELETEMSQGVRDAMAKAKEERGHPFVPHGGGQTPTLKADSGCFCADCCCCADCPGCGRSVICLLGACWVIGGIHAVIAMLVLAAGILGLLFIINGAFGILD